MSPAPKLLGKSPAFIEAIDQLERAGSHRLPVLILGESGTGKEAAARLVHAKSERAKGPFVALNMAALPATLVEDELFGHDVGAFTGANAARSGRFRRADGGTLFLDEIGDIPLAAQVKLLRALEEQVIEPLGSEASVAVDVRLVAATHRDLNALVAQGSFRPDLLYRLAVVMVALPALRDRAGDIDILAKYFATKPLDRLEECQLSKSALECLRFYSWPGNVRELENAVLRVRALSTSQAVDASSFAFLTADKVDRAREVARMALRLGVTFPEIEKALIEEAVHVCQGNEAEASRRLGITRRAIEYRLNRES